ncbi:MAG: GH92 family glycosyl hydrolase [Dysgonamonadaceae bacterium]|jgi:predicted alpha-1,2-mannosidase|nr:GH92 family glycosyl hydrolase [Dysgonamonadaceae bacterium]
MNINKYVCLLAGILAACATGNASAKRLSDYVDPFIGATTKGAEAGKTFPGAATPFGMVQLSPNTVTGGDNGSGYSAEHTSVEGFAFTQMSGIGWYGDLGNFLVMPSRGAMKLIAGSDDNPDNGYRSRIDKSSEIARAGYYSVFLTDCEVRAEATCTGRAGILRFTFPKGKDSRIQIDLARRVGGTSDRQRIRVVNENTIAGYMRCTHRCGGWGNGGGMADYTVYFYAQFSKPLKKYGVWSATIPDGHPRKLGDVVKDDYKEFVKHSAIIHNIIQHQGKHVGFFTEFDTDKDEQVFLKAGISFVSEEGAEKNLKAEISGWNFDGIAEANSAAWDRALGKVTVEGGSEAEKKIFYTALYRTMIDPRLLSDIDGKYPGGDGKVHETGDFQKRSIFSGWDVFRSQMPLQTIINSTMVSDLINSLVTLANESGKGYLERWEFLNAYSGCMVGNPAISVIADAYAKNIGGFNIDSAYRYAAATTEKFGNGKLGFTPSISWAGGVSTTLEHAYTEWCMAQLAKALGKADDYAEYTLRSLSYRNIWDKHTGWFRAKNEHGDFLPPAKRGRLHQDYDAVESNAFQQGWFVPHDIDGLAELIGGKKAAIKELDLLFDNTPGDFKWNDFYNHSNEPVHHIPFLYNRLGEPWKTQSKSRFICSNAYKEGVNGIAGNEDVGQMSAWYVLAASGIYPICPGETRFELTSPVFGKIRFNLDNGKEFVITTSNNSQENIYIKSAKLNNKTHDKCYIDYRDIINGGKLELEMDRKPNKKWGRKKER